MNLLFTLNKKYVPYFMTLLRSFLDYHTEADVYIISNDITEADLLDFNEIRYHILKFDEQFLKDAPTSKRYPKSIYYRIFASKILPNSLDRVLYLDPDIIIKGNLLELYTMDFEDNFFIGCTNVGKFLRRFNEIKNDSPKGAPYINTGVLLMNLKLLRDYQDIFKVYEYIKKHRHRFTLPDQDIISGLYGNKIKIVDHLIYNLSDRAIRIYNVRNPMHPITLDFVEKNTKIIHYYGRNKPWKENYRGILKKFYDYYKLKE